MGKKLKGALGMGSSGRIPPPWLINMQRFGPPPSYPGLKLPGLNAEIPAGCRLGYGPGEWGKPHFTNNTRAFHIFQNYKRESEIEINVDKAFEWGRLEEFEARPLSDVESPEHDDETEQEMK